MTRIAIASVNSPGLHLCQDNYTVAILEKSSFKTLTLPFKEVDEDGAVIIVGNPDFRKKRSNMFFASEIFDSDFEPVEVIYFPAVEDVESEMSTCGNQQLNFKFQEMYLPDIKKLLLAALEASPVRRGYFWSDNPFGPDKRNVEKLTHLNELWTRHHTEGLVYNTMYELCE
jgi:hypothetical protein